MPFYRSVVNESKKAKTYSHIKIEYITSHTKKFVYINDNINNYLFAYAVTS